MKRLIKANKQVGPIYHFTTVGSILKILDKDALEGHVDKYGCAISFTRNKNLWYNDRPVKIDVNGDMLSDKYKIEPFNFFQNEGTRPEGDKNESEERVCANVISPFKTYITNIDISRSKTKGIREQSVIDKLKNEYYIMEDVAKYILDNYGINVNIIP